MPDLRLTISSFLIFVAFAAGASGQADAVGRGEETSEPEPMAVPRTSEPMRIDGRLDEAAWDSALKVELEYEIQPGDNTPAQVRTEVLITYSKSHLYVGFRAYDPDPAAIRAHLSDRDKLGGDDQVYFAIDTFNDGLRGFVFGVNPMAIQTDLLVRPGAMDKSWDAIWDSGAALTDWGYAVEMAIPFNALRFPKKKGEQVWGFIAGRDYIRNDVYELRTTPNERGNTCWLCQSAEIKGFAGISPGRNIELTPTITAVRSDERSDFPDGPMARRDSNAEAGITARWGLTPNITLGGTFNPDFSQVEADIYKLDINERFALYYREKRPFFL